jgi:hypothetical protein
MEPSKYSSSLKFLGLWVLPALPYTIWLNRAMVNSDREGDTFDEVMKRWIQTLTEPTTDQVNTIISIYRESKERYSRLEAKAVGVLTAIAIVAAAATLACTRTFVAAIFGWIALVFLTSGGATCCWVLLPRMRHTLVISDVSQPHLIARIAATSQFSESGTLQMSNLITSALHDLLRALVFTLVAVLLFITIRQDDSQQITDIINL